MLSVGESKHGTTRRDFLTVGSLGALGLGGLTLPALLGAARRATIR